MISYFHQSCSCGANRTHDLSVGVAGEIFFKLQKKRKKQKILHDLSVGVAGEIFFNLQKKRKKQKILHDLSAGVAGEIFFKLQKKPKITKNFTLRSQKTGCHYHYGHHSETPQIDQQWHTGDGKCQW